MENQFHSNSPVSKRLINKQSDPMPSTDFYDCERGIGKQVDLICFGLKSGAYRSFAMNLFDEINFVPEGEIHLYARFCTVKIIGHHLKPLYQQLIQRRIKQIREFSEDPISDQTLTIEAIKIQSDYE